MNIFVWQNVPYFLDAPRINSKWQFLVVPLLHSVSDLYCKYDSEYAFFPLSQHSVKYAAAATDCLSLCFQDNLLSAAVLSVKQLNMYVEAV